MINVYKTFKNIKRIKTIASAIAKYGFGSLLYEANLSPLMGLGRKLLFFFLPKEKSRVPAPVRLRKLFEELGATFIKLGQFLSSRGDILSEEYILELQRLQDNTLHFEFKDILPIIEKCICGKIEDYFLSFDQIPFASASIAQVHKAVLKDGRIVAVKIKKPNIKEIINQDMSILRLFAKFAEKHIPEARQLQLSDILEELNDQLQKEILFDLEASYVIKFKNYFKDYPEVVFPEIISELSSQDVIIMSYIDGIKINDTEKLKQKNYNTKKLAAIGVDFYLKQVFEFGFFHADPHPGNILAVGSEKIAIIDFGIIGKVDARFLDHLSYMFISLMRFDIDTIVEKMTEIGIIDKDSNFRRIKGDMTDFLMPVYGKNVGQIDIAAVLERLIAIGRKYHFKFPMEYLLIMKSFAFLETTGRKLDADFNFLEFAKPFASKMIKKRYSPKSILKSFSGKSEEYFSMFANFPSQYSTLINKLNDGSLSVNFVHKGLENFSREIDRSANRLSFSIVIGAVVLASSIFVLSGAGPKVLGISALGLIGFITAGIFGIGLILGIIRSGKF